MLILISPVVAGEVSPVVQDTALAHQPALLVLHLIAAIGMQVSDLGSEQESQISSTPISDALQSSFSNPYLKTHALFL